MRKSAWTLCILVGAATLGPATAAAQAQNKRVCVEVVLQRPTAKPAAPAKAAGDPATAQAPAVPGASPTPPPAPATPPGGPTPPAAASAPTTPAPETTPAAPAGPSREVDTGIAAAGSEFDVLPDQTLEQARDRDRDRRSGKARKEAHLPVGQRPLAYLKRLLEHFVSHEKGFTAVPSDCQETLRVEMYPLLDGWTAFARYSGTGREERVDRLLPTELSAFAERAATALLYGKPISGTINRENVLTSDSKDYEQRISGTHHFIMGVGTQLRVGKLGTAQDDGTAREDWRFFSPVSLFLGYRGKFENWGLETTAFVGIGTQKTAARKNDGGGHVDLGGDAAIQLHFLHYFDPRGLTSFYLGGGTTFELLWFQAVRPKSDRYDGDRTTLLGGGLDVDAVFGVEFMRASKAQFFLQGELQMPAYVLQNENDSGGAIHGWFPSLGIKLGVLF